jgi:hypothetical protein
MHQQLGRFAFCFVHILGNYSHITPLPKQKVSTYQS